MKIKILEDRHKKETRKMIIIAGIILSSCHAYSQDKKTFVVNPGQTISEVVLPADMYRYANFTPGTVSFKDRRESRAPMNYNLLMNEVQFINAKGDTLSLVDEYLIKLIRIDSDSFFYSKGYYELINSFDHTRLVRKEVINLISADKIGAYDQPVRGGAAISFTNLNLGARSINLQVNEQITLKKEVSYHFADQYGHIMPALKKNLQKEFPKYSSAIEEYIKSNPTDFKNETDLEKLFNFLKQHK